MGRRRIPYQVAAHRLATRLNASPGEIALWVAGFVKNAHLRAFQSESDDSAPLEFRANLFPTDPGWLDYERKLAGCYFDEEAVNTIAPTKRFVSVADAIQQLEGMPRSVPDPAGLIRSRIRNDGLECLHPIAGEPDLDDDAEFLASLLPQSDFEGLLKRYFDGVNANSAHPSATGHGSAPSESYPGSGRVAWRRILSAELPKIDRQYGGKASVLDVIRWLREHGGDRILKGGEADELFWRDDNGTRQRVTKSTVSNAISETRRLVKGRH